MPTVSLLQKIIQVLVPVMVFSLNLWDSVFRLHRKVRALRILPSQFLSTLNQKAPVAAPPLNTNVPTHHGRVLSEWEIFFKFIVQGKER